LKKRKYFSRRVFKKEYSKKSVKKNVRDVYITPSQNIIKI